MTRFFAVLFLFLYVHSEADTNRRYNVFMVARDPRDSGAWAINDQGQVTGYRIFMNGLSLMAIRPFVWDKGDISNVNPIPQNGQNIGLPYSINRHGNIVGDLQSNNIAGREELMYVGQTPNMGLESMGDFGYHRAKARDISDRQEVVGWADNGYFAQGTHPRQAIRFSVDRDGVPGGLSILDPLNGFDGATAEAINNDGVTVGMTFDGNGGEAVLWMPGGTQGSMLFGTALFSRNYALAADINDNHVIVGRAFNVNLQQNELGNKIPLMIEADSTYTYFDTIQLDHPGVGAEANRITDNGIILGKVFNSTSASDQGTPIIWDTDGSWALLAERVNGWNSDWIPYDAKDINRHYQIAGTMLKPGPNSTEGVIFHPAYLDRIFGPNVAAHRDGVDVTFNLSDGSSDIGPHPLVDLSTRGWAVIAGTAPDFKTVDTFSLECLDEFRSRIGIRNPVEVGRIESPPEGVSQWTFTLPSWAVNNQFFVQLVEIPGYAGARCKTTNVLMMDLRDTGE